MSVHAPIAAIATAPGRGGIGVVRVSGADLSGLVRKLFQRDLTPRHAHYLPFKSMDGELLDEGIALYFRAPHSYTGEDVLELQGHGGPAVLRRVLDSCLAAGRDQGLRLAEPGEFTRRAFLNDRMDLAPGRGRGRPDRRVSVAARAAPWPRCRRILGPRQRPVRPHHPPAHAGRGHAGFPEEEIDFLEKYQARPTLDALAADLGRLIAQGRQGVILREGLHVVLAGQPNVGKSSLLNALAGDDIAIVTPIAGTTRDKVVQEIHIDGVPLHIVDTAGLRETEDTVESIGIARSWQEIERADLILHLQDATQPGDELDAQITARLPPRTPMLKVFNKVDLLSTAFPPGQASWASRPSADWLDALRAELLKIAGGIRARSRRGWRVNGICMRCRRRPSIWRWRASMRSRMTGCWICSPRNCGWRMRACRGSREVHQR